MGGGGELIHPPLDFGYLKAQQTAEGKASTILPAFILPSALSTKWLNSCPRPFPTDRIDTHRPTGGVDIEKIRRILEEIPIQEAGPTNASHRLGGGISPSSNLRDERCLKKMLASKSRY